jgi:hypothetical protein
MEGHYDSLNKKLDKLLEKHNKQATVFFVLVSALQKIQNDTYIKMRSVTTQRFKKSATFKKEEINSLKLESIGLT